MSAPLDAVCACGATPADDPTLAEHAVWCGASTPSPARIAEITSGRGRPVLDGELTWLAGDASRAELHIGGVRAGAFPLTEDLPSAHVVLAQKLGAVVAELRRTRSVLAQSENDLTGARLSLWEEEQDTARLRLAWRMARRRARRLRSEMKRRTDLLHDVQRIARDRTAEARGRAADQARLREELASANASLDTAAKALRAKDQRIAELETQAAKVAEFVAARAEYVTAIRETRNDHDYERWQGHAESRRQLAETLGLPVAWPAESGDPR